MAEYMRNRHAAQRDRAVAHLGGECTRCGDANDLQFHHTGTKSFTISDGLKLGWERLVKELDQCILLCRPCHEAHHASDAPHGSARRYWRGCRCTPCRDAYREHMREYRRQRLSKAR